jgi:hypothetical protein
MKTIDIDSHIFEPFDWCEKRLTDYRHPEGCKDVPARHREALQEIGTGAQEALAVGA